MTWLAPLLLLASLAVLGDALLRRLAAHAPRSLPLTLAAGAVALHAVLLALTLVGLRWHWAMAPALAFAALLWARRRTGPPWAPAAVVEGVTRRRLTFDWSAGVAAGVWAAIAGLAVRGWLVNPDFVYHWGLKARKFAVAGGLDFALLGPPSGWHLHPDYPTLLPELLALSTWPGGKSVEGPLLLCAMALFAAFLLALREALAVAGLTVFARRYAYAAIALVCGTFALVAELPGNADPLVAWALLLAVPALLAPASPGAAARVAVAAALAASSKIEGVPLACFVLGGWALAARAPAEPWRRTLRGGLAVAWPFAAVTIPWLWINVAHHLFSPQNSGTFDFERFRGVAPELGRVLVGGAWSGLALAVLALPALLLWRRGRWAAAVCLAQLAFYLWVYATAPVDSLRYVQWSFSRLLFHLLPAVFVLAIAGAADILGDRRGSSPGSSIARGSDDERSPAPAAPG